MSKKLTCLAVLAGALLLFAPGCATNVQGDDASPVFLVAEYPLLPLLKNVGDFGPLQINTTTVRSVIKAPVSGSTQFLDTQVEEYVVEWRRTDGGRATPPTERFTGTFIVPAAGRSTLNNFEYMSAENMRRPPLDQLFPFNGGIDRETQRTEIRCGAFVTYRGRTLSGQPVTGTGMFDMVFVYTGGIGSVRLDKVGL